ncbi:MAG: NTP transferase domain-containing protein, partial [Candidatus Omnitrophica bacterium]|nr:NTP transferase domain-containing protein [Candidatus Omnitrophota bacterium]
MEKLKLTGLVLVGGQSRRMGQDKGKLKYSGKEQALVCFDLLKKFCANVFLSTREEQRDDPLYKNHPQIHDHTSYQNIGPLGGILSAFATNPQTPWLVLGCDLPFVDEQTLQFLIDHRDSSQIATAYRSSYD